MSERTVIGEEELAQKFDDLSAILGGDTLQDMLMATGLVFERAAKEKIKERGLIDTGRLRASVVTLALNRKTVVVGVQNLEYAAIHEFGGIIRPKNGPYLHFKTKDGQWVKTKEVGMPARPYMRPAFRENVDKAVEEFNALFTAHMEKVART